MSQQESLPMDYAKLVSLSLEGIFYGLSLCMFFATVHILSSSSLKADKKMLPVACVLFILSTMHMVVDIRRAVEAFIFHSSAAAQYFNNLTNFISILKNAILECTMLLGDAVVIWRLHRVWGNRYVIVFPILLWFSMLCLGIVNSYRWSSIQGNDLYILESERLLIGYFSCSLAANFLTSGLLAYKILSVERQIPIASRAGPYSKPLRPALRVVLDSGLIYSVQLLIFIIALAANSNVNQLILEQTPSIISLVFNLIIIRVAIGRRKREEQARSSSSSDSLYNLKLDFSPLNEP